MHSRALEVRNIQMPFLSGGGGNCFAPTWPHFLKGKLIYLSLVFFKMWYPLGPYMDSPFVCKSLVGLWRSSNGAWQFCDQCPGSVLFSSKSLCNKACPFVLGGHKGACPLTQIRDLINERNTVFFKSSLKTVVLLKTLKCLEVVLKHESSTGGE